MQIGTKKAVRIIVFGLVVIASKGVLLAAQNGSASNTLPRKGNPTGRRTGQIAINPHFDFAGDFVEGLALVRIGSWETGKYGYIEKTGHFVINPQFDHAEDFADGLALVRIGDYKTGKWGYIDKSGKYVINLKFD